MNATYPTGEYYVLSQRVGDRWITQGAQGYDNMREAREAADAMELDTGRRVAIDMITPDGRARRVRGPD